MKQSGEFYHLRDQQELNGFVELIQHKWIQGEKPTVAFYAGERTDNQNRMFYALYSHVAKATHCSTHEARHKCKLHYGIPILRASDPEFAKWYDHNVKGLPYPLKLALMEQIPVTSEFTKEMGIEYIDAIIEDHRRHGITLGDPRA